MTEGLKKRIVFTIVIISISTLAWAQDFAQYGFKKTGERQSDNLIYSILLDSNGNTVLFASSAKSVSIKDLKTLKTLDETFYSWQNIKIAEIKIISFPERMQTVIIPSAFSFEGIDFLGTIPSGIQFYYTSYLEYDFRMKVQDYFIRMQGSLFSEQELLARMKQAVNDPVLFIKTHDPEYMIRKLTDLEKQDQVVIQNIEVNKKGISEIRENHTTDFQKLTEDFGKSWERIATLESEAMKTDEKIESLSMNTDQTVRDIEAKFEEKNLALSKSLEEKAAALEQVSKQRLSEMEEKFTKEIASIKETSAQEKSAAEAQVRAVRDAFAANMNRGWFSPPKMIAKEDVDTLIRMKNDNPSLNRKDAAVKMKELGSKINPGEIDIVFIVFFNEYQ